MLIALGIVIIWRIWSIRSQAPKSVNDKDMEKVQRLYRNGFERFDQSQW